jgi:hypothetical protein
MACCVVVEESSLIESSNPIGQRLKTRDENPYEVATGLAESLVRAARRLGG